MFAYCNNNPIVAADYNGKWLNFLIGAVVGAVVNIAVTVIDAAVNDKPLEFSDVLIAAGTGAASGALVASGVGLIGQTLGGAAIAMTSNATTQVKNIITDDTGNTSFNVGELLYEGVVGAVAGYAGGAGATFGNTAGIKACENKFLSNISWHSWNVLKKQAHNQGGTFFVNAIHTAIDKGARVGVVSILAKKLIF